MQRKLSFIVTTCFCIVLLCVIEAQSQKQTGVKPTPKPWIVATIEGDSIAVNDANVRRVGRSDSYFGSRNSETHHDNLFFRTGNTFLTVPWEKVTFVRLDSMPKVLILSPDIKLYGSCERWYDGQWLQGIAIEGKTTVSGFPANYSQALFSLKLIEVNKDSKAKAMLNITAKDGAVVQVSNPGYLEEANSNFTYDADISIIPLTIGSTTLEIPLEQVKRVNIVNKENLFSKLSLKDGRELEGSLNSELLITGKIKPKWPVSSAEVAIFFRDIVFVVKP